MFLRLSYLASISWASAGLWLLLFYPFDQQLLSRYAVLTALPYFVAISTDLRRTGYRRRDVFRLYGLNIMLLPVNTIGAARSIGQAIGGQKSAFKRTPKVKSRTITPLLFVAFPFVISGWSLVTLINDLAAHRYFHAGFAGANAALTLYVMLSLHGLIHSVADIFHDIRDWLFRPVRGASKAAREADWVTVLYHGTAATGESETGAAVAGALAAIDQESDAEQEIVFRVGGPASSTLPAVDPAAAESAEAIARALAERLRGLEPGAAVTMRMTGEGLQVGRRRDDHEPVVKNRRATDRGRAGERRRSGEPPRRRRHDDSDQREGVSAMDARRRLSFIRLLILAAAIIGLSFAGWTQGSEAYQRITAKPSSTWFAPYDDVTLTPEYHFEDQVVSPGLTQLLGFVVSDPKNTCKPTWGTYYDLDGAGRALDLDRRIARLRERGGDAIVSFGGAANTDLAVGCTPRRR